MAFKKRKKETPANNEPFMVLNYQNKKNWENLTENDLKEIIMTPVGLNFMRKYVQQASDEARKHVFEELVKDFQKKLLEAEDYIMVLNLFLAVGCIEEIYDEASKDKNKRGWQKRFLSKEDVIAGMIEKLGDEERQKAFERDNVIATKERIKEQYGVTIDFDVIDINKDFFFDYLSPYEDESIFQKLTTWEVYELGATNGDIACRLATTMSIIMSMQEDKRFTVPVIKRFVRRANEILEETLQDKDKFNSTLNHLKKIGIDVPKQWVDSLKDFIRYEQAYGNRFLWEGRLPDELQ